MSQANLSNPLGAMNPYRVKCPGSFVENYDCCSGRRSSYMPGGETWDFRHMYRPSNFNPFVVHGNIPYGPRSVGGCVPSGYRLPEDHHPLLKEDFYNSSANSWTTRGNVTPANGITYGTYMTPANKVEGYRGTSSNAALKIETFPGPGGQWYGFIQTCPAPPCPPASTVGAFYGKINGSGVTQLSSSPYSFNLWLSSDSKPTIKSLIFNSGYRCNPKDAGGCNVCKECCYSYISDCKVCFKQKCQSPAPSLAQGSKVLTVPVTWSYMPRSGARKSFYYCVPHASQLKDISSWFIHHLNQTVSVSWTS